MNAHHDHSGHTCSHGHGGHAPEVAATEHVDPVCGMTVKTDSPHHASHDGREYRFCSAGCRAKFVADPARFVAPSSTEPEALPAGTTYTCPMHPQIVRDVPGNCPICGMALEPVMPTLDDGPNPELRRLQASLLVDAAAVAPRCWCSRCSGTDFDGSTRRAHLARAGAGDAGRAVGGLAFLPALGAVDRQSQPQHVDADRHSVSARPTSTASSPRWRRASSRHRSDGARAVGGLLRGGRDHRLADVAGPGARAARALADLGGASRHCSGWRRRRRGALQADGTRGRHSARPRPRRRSPARATRREGAGRRRRARRPLQRRTSRC